METCDWFSTAKPGDEQISLKEHVERLTEEAVSSAVMRQSIPGAWINPCCPQVILSSAFSQCSSVSLRCFLTLCVERTLDATCALLMLHSTYVVCTSHHESQAKRVIYHGSGAGVIV